MRARRGVVAVVSGLGVGAALGGASCATPTELTVHLRADGPATCASTHHVAITVAGDPATAEARAAGFVTTTLDQCEATDLGTLVVTPGGATGAIVVAAQLGDAPCTPPAYAGCIVARRRFSFVDHVELALPITLDGSCLDVPCDELSSCKSGACVSSEADCDASGACTSDAEPGSPGGDGGPNGDGGGGDGSTNDGGAGDGGDGGAGFVDGGDGDHYAPDRTDLCPNGGAGTACATMDITCCLVGAGTSHFACLAPAQCNTTADNAFPCTASLDCVSGRFCCGYFPDGGATDRQSSACDLPSDVCPNDTWFCRSNADCPPGKGPCTGPGPNGVGGTIKTCVPP